MPVYDVDMRITVDCTYRVEAESPEDAREVAEDKWARDECVESSLLEREWEHETFGVRRV